MKIVIAPDSFKESLNAVTVAQTIEHGLRSAFPEVDYEIIPMADGGEGTLDAILQAVSGSLIKCTVTDPCLEKIQACYGEFPSQKIAVVEMAQASGLTLVPLDKRDPVVTTSYGTGELILSALHKGYRKIVIGIGGSATNDGGAGLLSALGVRFLDHDGNRLLPGGGALAELAKIDIKGLEPSALDTEFIVACDVDNPLCGPHGASYTYGPQKGASAAQVKQLERALENYQNVIRLSLRKNVSTLKGGGAAGGTAAGLVATLGAKLQPGVQLIAEIVEFRKRVQGAALVITGEGQINAQTAYGKTPVGIARIAKEFNIPVIAFTAAIGEGAKAVYGEGIDSILSLAPGPITKADCLNNAEVLLQDLSIRVGRLLRSLSLFTDINVK